MSINFNELITKAGTSDFALLPDATYDVVIEKAQHVTTSTNKPMIKATGIVQGGPNNGRKLFTQYVLSADNANALKFFFDHMAAYGLDKTFFAGNPSMDLVAQAIIGKSVRFEVGSKVYQGQDRNEVKNTLPPAGGVVPVIGGGGPGVPSGVSVPSPSAPVPQASPGIPSVPQASGLSSEELF